MRSSARIGVRPDARVQAIGSAGKFNCSKALPDVALKELQSLSASSILSLRRETIAVKTVT